MHVVMIHGYFLKGTGSNLFVRNICRVLCQKGHEVSLVCQENDVEDIDFIEEAFDFCSDNTSYIDFHSKTTSYKGKCKLYRPNLNGFLPVFVHDYYEGYEVKEFIACTQEEIESYLGKNKKALDLIFAQQDPDIVWTNHTIMQPVYIARSILGNKRNMHVMTMHGSCLNFAVKKSPLLANYAMESVKKVDRIVFVSDYSQDEFQTFFSEEDVIKQKSVVIPAGVDLEKFLPLDGQTDKNTYIQSLIKNLEIEKNKKNSRPAKSSWQTDENILSKLKLIDFEKERIILYYGKYLWTKGLQLLIAAAPLILQRHEHTRFIFVGFGSSRKYFESLVEALEGGHRELYIDLLKYPEKFDKEIENFSSQFFLALIECLKDQGFAETYFSTAQNRIGNAVTFTGFLAHDYLKGLIACSDVTTAPSIFPEAFGMVAVEALSAGIIPVQTNHSGFAEVIRKYVDEFCDVFDKSKMNPLYLDENLVLNMAKNISFLLDYYEEMDTSQRQSIRQRARNICTENYSWENIVERYLKIHSERR